MSTTDKTLMQRAGGRRFLLAVAVLATAIAARWLLWIDGAQLVTTLRDVLGIYGLANVGARATEAVKAAIEARPAAAAPAAPKPAPAPAPAPVKNGAAA